MSPHSRYQKLKQDFKTPFRAWLFSYQILKGPLQLQLKDDSWLLTTKADLPMWREYFHPDKVNVEFAKGLFKITPRNSESKASPYWVAGGNYMITHKPTRFYPEALQSTSFRRLQESEKKVFSQHGEDGVFEAIFRSVPAEHKFIIEFGAHDGVKMSNSRNLILNHQWQSFLIEADPRFYKKLQRTYKNNPRVKTLQSYITEENINRLFREAGAPTDFEILSIDVDSIDYYLWEALTEFKPRLVVVECNPVFPPDQSYVVSKEEAFTMGGTSKEGASFKAFVDLAERKGYTLIYVELIGSNLFFLDNKYLSHLGYEKIDSKLMYQPPQFGELAGGPALNGRGYP